MKANNNDPKINDMKTTDGKAAQALQSLDGIQPAQAKAGLYNAVLQNAGKGAVRQMQVNKMVYLRAAACIILLAGINIFTVLHYNKKQQQAEGSSNAFAGEYFAFLKNI